MGERQTTQASLPYWYARRGLVILFGSGAGLGHEGQPGRTDSLMHLPQHTQPSLEHLTAKVTDNWPRIHECHVNCS
jgi:hypothetical protein